MEGIPRGSLIPRRNQPRIAVVNEKATRRRSASTARRTIHRAVPLAPRAFRRDIKDPDSVP